MRRTSYVFRAPDQLRGCLGLSRDHRTYFLSGVSSRECSCSSARGYVLASSMYTVDAVDSGEIGCILSNRQVIIEMVINNEQATLMYCACLEWTWSGVGSKAFIIFANVPSRKLLRKPCPGMQPLAVCAIGLLELSSWFTRVSYLKSCLESCLWSTGLICRQMVVEA